MSHNKMIFVFGSNLSGLHGAGAAAYARRHKGAKIGVASGPTGQSYAIPTKDEMILNTLPMYQIKEHVNEFLKYAHDNSDKQFQVTRIGCGLAGLKDHQVAPLFIGAPDNCLFDEAWKIYLDNVKFWGTF